MDVNEKDDKVRIPEYQRLKMKWNSIEDQGMSHDTDQIKPGKYWDFCSVSDPDSGAVTFLFYVFETELECIAFYRFKGIPDLLDEVNNHFRFQEMSEDKKNEILNKFNEASLLLDGLMEDFLDGLIEDDDIDGWRLFIGVPLDLLKEGNIIKYRFPAHGDLKDVIGLIALWKEMMPTMFRMGLVLPDLDDRIQEIADKKQFDENNTSHLALVGGFIKRLVAEGEAEFSIFQ